MGDFNFVSIKIQSFFEYKKFSQKCLKNLLNILCKMFYVWILLFVSFVPFRRMDLCLRWLVVFSMSRMLNNEMYSFFWIFLNLSFNLQKSRISLFITALLALCSYSSHAVLCHPSFVLAPTFIFVILIFSVKKFLDLAFRFSSFLWFAIGFIHYKLVLRVC